MRPGSLLGPGELRRDPYIRAAEEATAAPERGPGFVQADRMTETNPLDARMSGDFRQY